MSDRPPMTVAGAERLRGELDRLRNVERPRVIRAIGAAREHGDLRENAEYHAAREEAELPGGGASPRSRASSLARRSSTPPASGRRARIAGRIVFGATVRLVDVETGDEHDYQIVGDLERRSPRGGSRSRRPSRAPSSAAAKATR